MLAIVEAISTKRKDQHESQELLKFESLGFTYFSFCYLCFIIHNSSNHDGLTILMPKGWVTHMFMPKGWVTHMFNNHGRSYDLLGNASWCLMTSLAANNIGAGSFMAAPAIGSSGSSMAGQPSSGGRCSVASVVVVAPSLEFFTEMKATWAIQSWPFSGETKAT
jgi:hypothetical protein